MPKSKVVVIGELNVDLIFAGRDVRLEPNREKLADDFRLALGSSSAITAAGLSGLGAEVEFVSVVGDDEFGHFCLKELERLGVGTRYVRIDGANRTGATLSLTDGHDRALLTYMGTIASVVPETIPEDAFAGAAHVHFGSFYLQERMRTHWSEVFRRARERGMTTSFDVGWDPREDWDRDTLKELLAWTDWFLPSEEEALRIFEAETMEELPARLPAKRGQIVVKRGAAGAAAFDAAGHTAEGRPFAVQPVDTTGAGDSFNAGWIAARLEGKDTAEALTFANACGALSTLSVGGAGTVSREGVDRLLAQR